MKRILSAGEGYTLFPTDITYRMPRYFPGLRTSILYTIGLFFMCLQVSLAQESTKEIIRVSAGQRLPEEFWTIEFQFYDHEKVYTQTLDQFRGKPLILDFWATTCSKCFEGFPFLKEMHSKYAGRLNIILVNNWYKDSLTAIERRFTKLDDSYRLTSIIQDKYLKELFPHNSIPHYIWISAIGRVYAVSTKGLVTEDNLLKLIKLYENQ